MRTIHTLTALCGAFLISLSAHAETRTQVLDLGGVLKALGAVEQYVGGGSWSSVSGNEANRERQQHLFELLPEVGSDVEGVPEFTAFADALAEPLNAKLEEAGFDIRLDPWPPGMGFGVVAILDLPVTWQAKGYRSTPSGTVIRVAGGYDGFRLDGPANRMRFAELPGSDEPVIVVETESGDIFRFWRTDAEPKGFELYALAASMIEAEELWSLDYAGADFPLVDVDEVVDISWLVGASIAGATITQALQQVTFVMDECGARVRSGTAVGATRSMTPPPSEYYEMNGSFMVVVSRGRMDLPLFAGFIGEDSFRNPGRAECAPAS